METAEAWKHNLRVVLELAQHVRDNVLPKLKSEATRTAVYDGIFSAVNKTFQEGERFGFGMPDVDVMFDFLGPEPEAE